MLEKPAMFPASESNGFMKKGSYTVQWLVFLGMSLMCAVCTQLLYSHSVLHGIHLKKLLLPAVGCLDLGQHVTSCK